MELIWRDIPEAEGYAISNTGKVKNKSTGKILKTWVNNSGYECIKINTKKVKFRDTIHRIVAKAFCVGYKEGLVVNHIDTNRLNNHASNLEWMTYKESISEMKDRNALNTHTAREAHKKNLIKKVDMYSKDGKTFLKTFDSIREAAKESGARPEKITETIKGRRFTAGGYHWKYNNPKDNYSYYTKGTR
ncbi:putative HNH endonuclease [Bacillus phage vB_BspH_TimeGriffin]|nr:putative HNH endonuclease [Bacillus phage vB_BspH_TimeGriffin]